MLLERNANYKSDKTNINEKFYKFEGDEEYMLHLQRKYLLRYDNFGSTNIKNAYEVL